MQSKRTAWLFTLALICTLAAPQAASAAPPLNDAFRKHHGYHCAAVRRLDRTNRRDDRSWRAGFLLSRFEISLVQLHANSGHYARRVLHVVRAGRRRGGIYADGAGLAGLARYACVDPFSKSAIVPVTAGRTYVFQAFDAVGNLGTLGLRVAVYVPPTPPANDDFADASAIPTIPFDTNLDLTAASVEPDEHFTLPHNNCAAGIGSVWYTFTAPQDETLEIAVSTPDNFGVYASVWREDGPGLAGLTGINCSSRALAPVKAGQTYAIDIVDFVGSVGAARLEIQIVPPPANDDFANAHVISTLPFSDNVDAAAATTQPGEITPTCAPGPINRSVWYAWTPTQDTFVNGGGSTWSTALYTGDDLATLKEVACGGSGHFFFVKALAGHTYWLQHSQNPDDLQHNLSDAYLEVTENMTPTFEWTPAPSSISPVQFGETRSDSAGELSQLWMFGDGATGSGPTPTHRYLVDGTYHVTLTVTTIDGRTETGAADVEVRTHDVGILDVRAPASARVGQTIVVTVQAVSLRYTEILAIALATSRNGGESVGDLIREVALGKAGGTFSFPYTITQADAAARHVTFTATAYVLGLPDAFPANNTKTSKPATTIIGR